MRFWDSSALIPLLLNDQPSSTEMRRLLARDPETVLWWGAAVECASAVARLGREKHLTEDDVSLTLTAFRQLHRASAEIQPGQQLRERAVRLLRVHPLRAADALQLAAALAWSPRSTEGRGFVCLDTRLREAAAREGFDVFPKE